MGRQPVVRLVQSLGAVVEVTDARRRKDLTGILDEIRRHVFFAQFDEVARIRRIVAADDQGEVGRLSDQGTGGFLVLMRRVAEGVARVGKMRVEVGRAVPVDHCLA
jgi:hypothetical protein